MVVRGRTTDEGVRKVRHEDHELTEPIPCTRGVGLRFRYAYPTDKEEDYITVAPKGKRKVHAEITSWIGAIGAKHYYARITVPGVSASIIGSGDEGHFSTSATCFPDEARSMDIEITKISEKDVLDTSMFSDAHRLKTKKGDRTGDFDTPNEARDRLLEEIKRLFPEGWEVDEGELSSSCREFGITTEYGDDKRYDFYLVVFPKGSGAIHLISTRAFINTLGTKEHSLKVTHGTTNCGLTIKDAGADKMMIPEFMKLEMLCPDCIKKVMED